MKKPLLAKPCVISAILLSVCFSACKKSSDNSVNALVPPTVMTSSAIVLGPTSIAATGDVLKLSSPITDEGVAWSSLENSDVKMYVPSSPIFPLTPFSATVTGLTPGKSYFIQAYATNKGGTGYGLRTLVVTPLQ